MLKGLKDYLTPPDTSILHTGMCLLNSSTQYRFKNSAQSM